MQQNQKQIRSADLKAWKVNPPLWEAICSTILANPAEQSVVRQVIGETLIQKSAFLHREALALHNILSAVNGNQLAHETQGNVAKQNGQVEDNFVICADSLVNSHHSTHRKDGKKQVDKQQIQSRASVVGSSKLSKTSVSDANVPLHQSKAKKDNNGINRLDKARKSAIHGDRTCKISPPEAARSLPQRSTASSSSSMSSDKTQPAIRRNSILSDQIDDKCAKAILPDYMELVLANGEKINAYDIDEVVYELRDAFATEQVYLNQLVEQLRRALDDCIDSYPMAQNKSEEITGQVRCLSRAESSESADSCQTTRTSKGAGHVLQRPRSFDSTQATRSSRDAGQVSQRSPSPSIKCKLVPIAKMNKVEKLTTKPILAQFPNATVKPVERPPLMPVTGTAKSPNLPARERRRKMS
ncbi:hypothetical protein L7F22_068915 [Adiantum nelumboides]|nr:hypothetical protein [Adiantum nelumboides]